MRPPTSAVCLSVGRSAAEVLGGGGRALGRAARPTRDRRGWATQTGVSRREESGGGGVEGRTTDSCATNAAAAAPHRPPPPTGEMDQRGLVGGGHKRATCRQCGMRMDQAACPRTPPPSSTAVSRLGLPARLWPTRLRGRASGAQARKVTRLAGLSPGLKSTVRQGSATGGTRPTTCRWPPFCRNWCCKNCILIPTGQPRSGCRQYPAARNGGQASVRRAQLPGWRRRHTAQSSIQAAVTRPATHPRSRRTAACRMAGRPADESDRVSSLPPRRSHEMRRVPESEPRAKIGSDRSRPGRGVCTRRPRGGPRLAHASGSCPS